MRRISLLLGWSLLAACASFPKLDLASLPDGARYPDARVVVLLDETLVDYFPGGADGGPRVRQTYRWRAKVLKPTELPPVRWFYSRTFARVESVKGRVIDPSGKERPLDLSKQADLPAVSGSVLFSDERVVVVPVPPVPEGGVFEYEVVEWQDDVRHFAVSQVFGDRYPVVVARVVATAPAGWELRWRIQAFDSTMFDPAIESTGSRRQWVFERRDLPAIELEEDGPPRWALSTLLSLRLDSWTEGPEPRHAFASPEEMSRWLAAAYAERAKPSPDMEATVRDVLRGVDETPEARAKALYEFACRRVQYCAIEIGYGGWIPHAAKDVHATRYGDCKDKATYLHSLLALAGVKSAPTVIYAHTGYPKPFTLPSLGANFNHAILAVYLPSGTVYVDPTQRAVPFGEVPASEVDAPLLELTPEGSPLRKMRESRPDENVETQRFTLSLTGLGELAGRFAIEASGSRSVDYRHRVIEGTGKLEPWVQKKVWLREPQVDSAQAGDVTDFGPSVSLAGAVHTRRALNRGPGGAALLRLVDVLRPSVELVQQQRRKSDLVRKACETVISEIAVRLPAGATVTRLPKDVALDSRFGSYRLSWKAEADGTVTISRQVTRTKRIIPTSQLEEFNAYASLILAAEAEPVVLQLAVAEAAR